MQPMTTRRGQITRTMWSAVTTGGLVAGTTATVVQLLGMTGVWTTMVFVLILAFLSPGERHTRSTKVDDPIDNQHEEQNTSEFSRPIVPVTSMEPDFAAMLTCLEERLAQLAGRSGGNRRRWWRNPSGEMAMDPLRRVCATG